MGVYPLAGIPVMRRAAILALFVLAWAVPAHAFLFLRVGGTSAPPAQTIASVGPSTGSFIGGASSGTVATMAAVMSPASPAFSGTYALSTTQGGCNSTTGANNADFTISGSSLELAGTLAAGTYKACVIAQQGGISNSPQSVAMTITGSSPGVTLALSPAPTSCGFVSSCNVSMSGLTAGDTVTIGNTWCTGVGCGQQFTTITGITDTNGNSCTAAANTLQNIDPESQIWVCPVNNSGNDTFSVTTNQSVFQWNIYPREWAEAAFSAPTDVGSSATNTGTTASLGVTTTVTGDVIYSVGNFAQSSPTVTANQTAIAANGYDEYQTVGAPGAHNNSWGLSPSAGWGASILALKPVVISSVALSSDSFTAGQGSGTVIGSVSTTLNPASPGFTGTDSIVSTGTDHSGTACTSTNATNFQMVNVSGTWELELNTTLGSGTYPGVCVASAQSGLATVVQAFTISGITQTMQLPVLSNNTYAPNTANAAVGTVTETPSPMNPPFNGSLTITGTNSGGFHLVGTGCTTTTGACTLEANSSGTTGPGPYSDFNIVATQAGLSGSPQQITPTVVSPPANTIAVSDASGLGATNYPIGFGRPFNPGFIPAGSCPQVTYEGAQLQTQTDVENYYSDGSIKWAEISVVLPSIPAAAKLPTSAAGSGTTLTFSGSLPSWMANGLSVIDADHPSDIASGATVASFTTNTVTVSTSVSSVGSGDYIQFGTETISIAAVSGGSFSGSHVTATSGSCATSSPLSVSAMLANYNFDAHAIYSGGVSPSGSNTISARAMLTDAATCSSTDPMSSLAECRLIYYGPARNTIWLADNTETSTCPGGSANGASKWDVGFGDGFCPLRPEFLATFWPGISQAHVRFVSDTGMYNAYQDVGYVATVTVGNTSPATLPGFPLDLTGTGNGNGQGITGLTANQTVASSYTGNFTIAGTPSASLTTGQWYDIYDNNTGEWFQANYNSTTQIGIFGRGVYGYPSANITSGDVLTVAPVTTNFGFNTANSALKRQWHGSDWTVRSWIGDAPNQEINIDNNLAYLDWTHYITNLDPSIKVPESVIAGPPSSPCDQATSTPGHYYGYTGWYLDCTNLPYDGDWNGGVYAMDMGTYGGRPEIGIQPEWESQWLNTGDWRMRTISEARADNFSNWEFHLIQTSPSAKILRYDTAGTGFGLPATTQGNPGMVTTFGIWPGYSQNAGYGSSVPTVTATPYNNGGPWSEMDTSHAPMPYYVPYILTGDPYYLREMGEWSVYAAAQDYDATVSPTSSAASGPLDNNGKGTYTASLGHLTESRYPAWDIRNFAETANAWPDGDEYQTYFISGTNDKLAALAGAFQVGSSSRYYGTKMYNWGAGIGSGSVTLGPQGFCSAAGQSTPSPIGEVGCVNGQNYGVGDCEAQGISGDETLYQAYFVDGTSLAAELGFPNDVSQWSGRVPIGFYSSAYPELYSSVSQGFNTTDSSNNFFPTMTAVINNFTSAPNGTSYLTNSPPYTGLCNNSTSVPTDWSVEIKPWQQAAFGTPGLSMQVDQGATGANTAWAWYNPNYMQTMNAASANPANTNVGWSFDPTWDVVPRSVGDTAPEWSFDPTIQ